MYELIIFGLCCVIAYNNAKPLIYLRRKVSEFINKRYCEDSLLVEMINCEVCSSFHVGWITALLYPIIPVWLVIGVIVYGIVTSFMFLYYETRKDK